jgi:endoplasmic reticulum chaperone BiP
MATIGIDLGNNFARVALLRDRIVEHVLDENGNTKTPCFVAFTAEDERLIGQVAKDQVSSLIDARRAKC